MNNWSRYLESLCNAYAKWWQVYTITDVVGQKRIEAESSPFLFDFGLMVQTVERNREEKVERLSVLDGLRKYASEHVLLVGRPGSGKSTALARLVLEEAGKARTPLNPPLARGEEDCSTDSFTSNAQESLAPPLIRGAGGVKIPALVELRYYRTSILDLIQDFLQRHDPNLTVDAETLKTWLRQGQLLLLVDGLNELPSEEARRDLHKLRQDYQKTTPMIFTTRDLGVGGDLDIAKKLGMQPLTEAQMQQFVRAYLPEQGNEMLRQLGSRLREFGQTPLLLWMLCSVFADNRNRVPSNLGSVFRWLTQIYTNKLKQDIPTSKEFRRWCPRLLEQLAWVMTCGEEKTQLQVAIPKHQAEAELTKFLAGKVAHPEDCALSWIEDLLKHHLIQMGAGDQIEFRHQLIQEYYTAESLLKLLPSLSDDELKREYLNYLKWTEPLALMLELVEDEAQAVRVVKLALEVDLRLGARLAGEVKPEWQEQTVGLVNKLDVPLLLKFHLLGLTKSERAIPKLVKALENEDFNIRRSAATALGNIDSSGAIPELVNALKDENSDVRRDAAAALGSIGSEVAISELMKALEHEDKFVRWSAAQPLRRIASEVAVPKLNQALEHEDPDIRIRAAEALGFLRPEAAIPRAIKDLKHEYSDVRWHAAENLGNIGSDEAIPALVRALDDGDSNVRWRAAEALGKIGSEAAISELKKAVEHEYHDVRVSAAEALRKIRSDSDARRRQAEALGNIGLELPIPELIKALKHEYSFLRWRAAEALGNIGSDAAISELVKALENEDFVRANNGYTLEQAIKAVQVIQEKLKLYNPTLTQPIPTPEPPANIPPIQSISTSLMHILHLSDLHFGTPDQANLWSNQLAADLYNDLNIPHLDALILSGDIANYSTEEEYKAAAQFLHNLRQDFPLTHEQIILVPGNHDLNWKLAKKAYKLIDRDDYDGELFDGHYIEESASVIRVRDEEQYKQRFENFSQFYETIKQNPYALDYDQQYTLDHLKEQNLLILGLNSAWQLDHHYKSRANIHMGALTNALTQIRRNPDYKNCLKIAVWHHPLDSAYSDRITDQGFLEQLAVNNFRFFLHGHIHKAETSLYRYDMSTNGRKLDRICAGTFGTPVRGWTPGYPLQYNLLKIEDNHLSVYTRRREEPNGAWKPDARWLQGAGKPPLYYYEIPLS